MTHKRNPVYDSAYQMYLDGLSLEQVANELGVTRQCVFKAFKKRNFILRGVNFRPHQYYDSKKFTLRNIGYYSLTTDDRVLMHRYVWENEKGIIPDGYDIHHFDEDRSNNKIENLECLAKSEHTKLYSPSNNQYGKGKRPVEMLTLNGEFVKRFANTSEAAKQLNVHRTAICMAINGVNKTSCKHKWRYASN